MSKFVIEKHTLATNVTLNVVRDDLLFGGTKIRALDPLIKNSSCNEFVIPSPAYGFAQIAIAACCKKYGKKAVVFVAKRNKLYRYTQIAKSLGATIIQIPDGRLVVVCKRAKDYVAAAPNTRCMISWGASDQIPNLVKSLKKLEPTIKNKRVWVCVGSGTLLSAMITAWPNARFMCLLVGADQDLAKFGNRIEKTFYATQRYDQPFVNLFPWPANSHYEAKLFPFVTKFAKDDDVVWNVAGDTLPD